MVPFIVLSVVAVGSIVAGFVCYYKLAVPSIKPLSDADIEICRRIIQEGEAYPWVCKRAIRKKECPCLPCQKLNERKRSIREHKGT